MIKFSEFVVEEHQPNRAEVENHIKILKKTAKSMTSHYNAGGEIHHLRGFQLTDRYNTHKDKLKSKDYKAWVAYCDEMRSDKSHCGNDFYA